MEDAPGWKGMTDSQLELESILDRLREQPSLFMDPVEFCEAFFHHPQFAKLPLRLKWWQKQLLRTDKRFNAVRIRRRAGKTTAMVCWALWKLFTTRDYRVVIVTPRESHLDSFWSQIEHQIESSIFSDSVVRKWLKPFRYKKFTNGSTIKGFCTGMSVRSHGCDAMIVDEADRFKSEDWAAFVPLWGEEAFFGELTDEELSELGSDDPLGNEVTVFLTTTIRTGQRDRFYWFCTDPNSPFLGPQGKDWSFPADQDPDVTPQMLEEWRQRMTQEEFENEILCIWGSSTEGVYRSQYIDRSIYPGLYHQGQPYRHAFRLEGEFEFQLGVPGNSSLHGWARPGQLLQRWPLGAGPIVLGADWDKSPERNLGPAIYAVQFDEDPRSPTSGKFRTLFCYQFPYTQYCVLGAVHLILQLAQAMQPAHIYLERGFGGDSQAEFLAVLANQMGLGQLIDRIRVVGLNEVWEIEHPVTGEVNRVQVKQHMVFTCSVLPIEQGRVVLSEEDDSELIRQLRNYRKVGQTQYGWKFNDEDEHLVDAFNLCMLALIHEVQPHWDYGPNEELVQAGPPLAAPNPNWSFQGPDEDPYEAAMGLVVPGHLPGSSDELDMAGLGWVHSDSDVELEPDGLVGLTVDRGSTGRGWGLPRRPGLAGPVRPWF